MTTERRPGPMRLGPSQGRLATGPTGPGAPIAGPLTARTERPPATARERDGWLRRQDRRIAIMGGTFDPIHYGHLAVAEETGEALGVDRVVFIPARIPPHKPGVVITPAEDRAAMVALAIVDNAAFAMSTIELEREGPSYTVDTLEELADEAASQGIERELNLVLSTESLAGLPAWRDPWRLISLCRIAVVSRPGYAFPDRAWLEARFPGRSDRIRPVETVPLTHSASEIRARVAAGTSIRYLVPSAVEAYIRDHRLYRS